MSKAGSQCCELSLKAPQDEEETEEAIGADAAAAAFMSELDVTIEEEQTRAPKAFSA